MDREFSQYEKGQYTYFLTKYEKIMIAEALKKTLKDYDRKVEKIDNNPRNEGQVKYRIQIEELRAEKRMAEKIIEEFLK